MKTCPNCNASVIDTAKFCNKCRFNIKKYEDEQANAVSYCTECGAEIQPDSVCCTECGHDVVNVDGNNVNNVFDPSWLSELEENNENKELAPFEYEEHNDGTYTITGLKDKLALSITVPKGVVAIGNNAFEGCEAINITLPEGLLKIGNASFKASQDLANINLPSSLVYIGDEAFMDCIMLDIELPSTIRKVGKDAMKNTAPDKKRQEEEARKAEEKRQAELAKWEIGGNPSFGSYYQSGSKQPIEWIVLTREDNKALLISKYALDCKPYNTANTNITWEGCTLRKWLNNEFINNAFNSEEQGKIQVTSVLTSNRTNDKIFLLSIDEANKYFASDDKRKCKVTAYAKSNGAYADGSGYGYWWLRSPGLNQDNASYVYNFGSVDSYGNDVDYTYASVRPALWINL